jgi:transcriptional regulator with XRE-family HTH domain
MPTIMQRLGKNLKRIRQVRGLSQQALADKVRVNRVYVAKIEGAVQAPSLDVLDRLAKALKVKVGELVE